MLRLVNTSKNGRVIFWKRGRGLGRVTAKHFHILYYVSKTSDAIYFKFGTLLRLGISAKSTYNTRADLAP